MATLISLLARVRSVLMDLNAQIWTDGVITEGLRLAVGEYALASAAPASLEGLDGASASSFPAGHESMLVWGAAAYAALARAVDRAESFQPGGEAGDLKTWGDARLREFKSMLGVAFPGYRMALAGSSGGSSGDDPGKIAAETALLQAQAAAVNGQESRAAAAADAAAQARIDEAARLADLRNAGNAPWGAWD